MKFQPEEQKHATRLAFVTLFLVLVLAIVAVQQLRGQGTHEQQAAVLKAYAR